MHNMLKELSDLAAFSDYLLDGQSIAGYIT